MSQRIFNRSRLTLLFILFIEFLKNANLLFFFGLRFLFGRILFGGILFLGFLIWGFILGCLLLWRIRVFSVKLTDSGHQLLLGRNMLGSGLGNSLGGNLGNKPGIGSGRGCLGGIGFGTHCD